MSYEINRNLYEETINKLEKCGKTEHDIRWIGTRSGRYEYSDLKSLFDVNYDAGYGGAEINESLLVVGDDWWLERHEYDGSEWWEFKSLPMMPEQVVRAKVRSKWYYMAHDDFGEDEDE